MFRSSKGRQKLEMVEITSESRRRVTFSKRRSGIFKKASELSALCGAEVAIIEFSGKKAFSYGHPSVEKVSERFISGNTPHISGGSSLGELSRKLSQSLDQLEMEKNRGQELDRKASLRELRHDVAREAEKILIQNLNHPQPMVTQNTSTAEVLPFDT